MGFESSDKERRRQREKKTWDSLASKERKRAVRKLKTQRLEADARAHYGPSGKPAPVVVRRIGDDT